MNNKYKGIIWTNHAIDRLRERGIKQSDAWLTFYKPDQSRYAKAKGAWIYYKTWKYKDKKGWSRYEKIEVVANKNDRGEWIIISVWSKPVYGIPPKFESEKKSIFARLLSVFR